MPTYSHVNNLCINKLTSAQFNAAVQSGTILDSDISILSDGEYIQYSTMPRASEENENLIVQYIGETNSNYTNGYWYKCVLDQGPIAQITLDRTDLLQITSESFASFWAYAIPTYFISSFPWTVQQWLEGFWPVSGVTPGSNYDHRVEFRWFSTQQKWQVWFSTTPTNAQGSTRDFGAIGTYIPSDILEQTGIHIISTPAQNETVIVKPIYYRASSTYKWVRIDVQPAIQREILNATNSNYPGEIVQYIGTSTANYTQGYFYKSNLTGTEIVNGTCTITEYVNDQYGNTSPDYYPTFIFDKATFDAYLASEGEPANTGTTIRFTWEDDPNTGDTMLTAHYNTNDQVWTILIDQAGEPLNQTYAVLGFTTNFVDPDDDPVTASEQMIGQNGHITITLPTTNLYSWERTDVQPNIQREVLDNTSNYNGEIIQYIGNTTDNYTQGYFYKSVNGYEYAGETDRTYSGTNYMYLSVDNLKLTSFLNLYGYTYTDTNIILLSITSDPTNPYTVSSLNGDIDTSFSSIEELRAWTGINWGGTNYVTSTDPNAIRSTSNTSTEFKVTPGYLWEHIAVAGPDIVRDYTSTDIRIILSNVNNNKIFDLGEPATITIEGDLGTSEDFCCQINFGSTDPVPTNFITAGGIGINMSGDDIDFTTHEFVPVTGRAYTIFFYYARNTFRGIVQGV